EVEKDSKGRPTSAILTTDGKPVEIGGMEKMAKSKNNGVDPQSMIDLYGADTVRLFIMFAAPPDQSLEWSDTGVEGANRYLKRLWRLVHQHLLAGTPGELDLSQLTAEQKNLRRKTHETIKKITDDMGRRITFNTAIAAVMELTNELSRFNELDPLSLAIAREGYQALIIMLSPITPHICHKLWQELGNENSVIDAPWPQVDETALTRDSLTMAVSFNGKPRVQLEVPANADKDTIEKLALADEKVQKHLEGKTLRKIIVVPGKLINLVVG
ncbi:MAG: class I tRNA ligase family protein, partial [Pseudomonadaceae bacterium]|nr:class I tRNA ligase family protein [Pseudomonadaceae bacterium]